MKNITERLLRIMPWLVIVLVVEISVYCVMGMTKADNKGNYVTENSVEQVLEPVQEAEEEVEETPKYTEEDVALLARLVYGEARGEPYEGQVAVAAVVLNRMKTAGFPNTMEGVIFQKLQFSCVDDGQFYLDIPEDSSVYQAAIDALEGIDPTNGCVYFYNPEISTSQWIFDNTQTLMTIGNHRFAIDK